MSGKSPGQGERRRATASEEPTNPGVTTRSRSRGPNRPSPYPPPGTPAPTGAPSRPAFQPPKATQGGPERGVKRGPPRGCGSPTKRGPASPLPPSKGASSQSGGQLGTPSREITQGLARCSIGQQGTTPRRALFQDSGTQPDTLVKGVSKNFWSTTKYTLIKSNYWFLYMFHSSFRRPIKHVLVGRSHKGSVYPF